jgi:hypothetical protein
VKRSEPHAYFRRFNLEQRRKAPRAHEQTSRPHCGQTDAQSEARRASSRGRSAVGYAHVAPRAQSVAHTGSEVASVAASLMRTGNKQERTVAASVLADHKTNGDKRK